MLILHTRTVSIDLVIFYLETLTTPLSFVLFGPNSCYILLQSQPPRPVIVVFSKERGLLDDLPLVAQTKRCKEDHPKNLAVSDAKKDKGLFLPPKVLPLPPWKSLFGPSLLPVEGGEHRRE